MYTAPVTTLETMMFGKKFKIYLENYVLSNFDCWTRASLDQTFNGWRTRDLAVTTTVVAPLVVVTSTTNIDSHVHCKPCPAVCLALLISGNLVLIYYKI